MVLLSCAHAFGACSSSLKRKTRKTYTGSRNQVRFEQRKPVYRAAVSRSIAFWVENDWIDNVANLNNI